MEKELTRFIIDSCKRITDESKETISETIRENTSMWEEASKTIVPKRNNNMFSLFVFAIICIALSVFGIYYFKEHPVNNNFTELEYHPDFTEYQKYKNHQE